MIRNLSMAALAACLIWPATSVTQNAPQPRVRARPRVRVETGPFGVYSFSGSRGRIGVVVDTKADAAGDKIGARIEGVTPGGPAEKAGLKAGDVITRFNTTSLGGATAEEGEDSGPGLRLIELAHRLEPGDTVQVEYRRGSETHKAAIVAEDLPVVMLYYTDFVWVYKKAVFDQWYYTPGGFGTGLPNIYNKQALITGRKEGTQTRS